MPFRSGLLVLNASWALACLCACGAQFADPISSSPTDSGAAGEAGEACPPEWVARFDGATFATTTRPVQDDFTIEAWIQTSSSPASNHFSEGSALVFADVEKIAANDFAVALANGKLLFNAGKPDEAVAGTSTLTTGKWVHFAISRSKTTGIMLVFINGILEGSGVGNTESLSDEPTLTIGGRAGRNFFSGLMSELRIWQRVCSQSEILANMHHRLIGNETGLSRYYPLNDQQGALARDASSQARDAELVGTPSWEQASSPFCPHP
ncbi:MAG TPA: LamG domain-containing protein [Polyangiaceae bacterium]|nr:LamG domain-containing protein [Polyangiaceae bacterium]